MKDFFQKLFERIKCVDGADIAERALWTFVEGALVALPVTFSLDMDGAAWKAILFSAILGGVSALKTFLLDVARQHLEKEVVFIPDDEEEEISEADEIEQLINGKEPAEEDEQVHEGK